MAPPSGDKKDGTLTHNLLLFGFKFAFCCLVVAGIFQGIRHEL